MQRRFNITGSCNPQMHYMVRLDDRMEKIKNKFVDGGSYFVINRGRQYGKTTTLSALEQYLKDTYIVLSLDFQEFETENFENGVTFSHAFAKKLYKSFRYVDADDKEDLKKQLLEFDSNMPGAGLSDLFECLSMMCENSSRPIVLMIDEVDSASNNQVFIDFLAQLRGYYLKRDRVPAFHSVILASVYRLKNIHFSTGEFVQGHKFANDLLYIHQYNSPWNIAAKFDIVMSFSTTQIVSMLEEYEGDYHTEMDIQAVAEEIYAYTSGYPVLVSLICKFIDENLQGRSGFEDAQKAWSVEGVAEAVKNILKESMPLFESMIKQLDIYKDLDAMIRGILYQGRRIPFEIDVQPINIGVMFGFLKESGGQVAVANRIFEMKLLNTFITREALESESYRSAQSDMNQFIQDGRLNMTLLLEKFVTHFHEVYGMNDERFIEDNGRKFFLLYLKPVVNGIGNYYIEAQTRDARRTDVIVDYRGEQFIVELKIWRGKEYNERGERQLAEYLDYYHKDKGYMVSFNFNQKKETGVKELQIGSKTIVEAVV